MRRILSYVKSLLIIFFLLLSQQAMAQKFLDKDFYLVDSLNPSEIEIFELDVIDSVLKIYHASESAIDQITQIDFLAREIKNDKVWPKYNRLRLEFCYFRMFSELLTDDERNQFKRIFAEGVNGLGQEEINRGNLVKSMDYFLTCLELYDGVGSNEDFAAVYSNMGTAYFHQADLVQAEYYLKLCHDSLSESENYELVALSLNNLAVIYQEKKELDLSLAYHYQSLDLSLAQDNQLGAAMSYNNIGGIYSQWYLDSLAKGELYLKKALTIFKDLGSDDWIAMTYYKIALTQLKMNNYVKAEMNANFSLLYAIQSQQSQPLLRAYRTLYKVKKQIGKPNEALVYYERFVQVKDSIYSADLQIETAEKEMEYQYKAEKSITQKENEKRLAIEKAERERQQNINYWIIAFIALTLIFAIVQLSRNRKIKKQNELIEKQSEERKILLKEIHHRVKNNFQIICSVLRLQAHDENNPVVDRAFEDAVNRIQSMAEVHEMIYKEESFSNIDPKGYFERLTNSIQHLSYDREITYHLTSDFEDLPMEVMISLGISVNELITNSIKHAFKNKGINPEISISLVKSDGSGLLTYTDNGIGYDAKTMEESFGTELIKTIIEQIQGELHYRSTEVGSEVKISFNLNN